MSEKERLMSMTAVSGRETKKMRVILNCKGASNQDVRDAIYKIWEEGQPLDVRTTWEGGDAARFAKEALAEGVDVCACCRWWRWNHP
jgi:diacylglycerol kinase family enzyme